MSFLKWNILGMFLNYIFSLSSWRKNNTWRTLGAEDVIWSMLERINQIAGKWSSLWEEAAPWKGSRKVGLWSDYSMIIPFLCGRVWASVNKQGERWLCYFQIILMGKLWRPAEVAMPVFINGVINSFEDFWLDPSTKYLKQRRNIVQVIYILALFLVFSIIEELFYTNLRLLHKMHRIPQSFRESRRTEQWVMLERPRVWEKLRDLMTWWMPVTSGSTWSRETRSVKGWEPVVAGCGAGLKIGELFWVMARSTV